MSQSRSPIFWPALSVVLFCFPLIWVGGLVTTHDAGMAVYDWPGTFGYNLFLYPISTWISGPYDLFVEHGHRLLGAFVGCLAIWLSINAYRFEKRAWVRAYCYILLLAITGQGLLGGVRVLFDAKVFAMVHGCTAALVFALSILVLFAARKTNPTADDLNASPWIRGVAWFLLACSYFQLVLGAQLRHAMPTLPINLFTSFVHLHLTFAAIVTLTILAIAIVSRTRRNRVVRGMTSTSNWLLLVVVAQVCLGFATWIVNYAMPWQELNRWLAQYVISGKGFAESMIVTGHQATGSLLIAFSVWLTSLASQHRLDLSIASTTESDTPAGLEKATEN